MQDIVNIRRQNWKSVYDINVRLAHEVNIYELIKGASPDEEVWLQFSVRRSTMTYTILYGYSE